MNLKNGVYFKIPNLNLKDTSVEQTHYAFAWGNWVLFVNSKKVEENKKFNFISVLN